MPIGINFDVSQLRQTASIAPQFLCQRVEACFELFRVLRGGGSLLQEPQSCGKYFRNMRTDVLHRILLIFFAPQTIATFTPNFGDFPAKTVFTSQGIPWRNDESDPTWSLARKASASSSILQMFLCGMRANEVFILLSTEINRVMRAFLASAALSSTLRLPSA